MTTIEQFIAAAEGAKVRLTVDPASLAGLKRIRDDAFFQAPLLSLCLIVVTKGKDGQLATADVPTWIGATLTKHFDDSSAIRRQLEWSLDYRRRCADCIVFLENIELVTVVQSGVRMIRCTDRGGRFLREALKKTDEIGVLARALTKAHRVVEHHGLGLL
jgi:hypothetical protein